MRCVDKPSPQICALGCHWEHWLRDGPTRPLRSAGRAWGVRVAGRLSAWATGLPSCLHRVLTSTLKDAVGPGYVHVVHANIATFIEIKDQNYSSGFSSDPVFTRSVSPVAAKSQSLYGKRA